MAKDPYKYFRIEGREILEGLTQGVLDLEKGEAQRDVLGRLFRLAHTLKGASRVVKQPEIAERAHALEDLLAPHRGGETPVPRECTTALFSLIDSMTASLAALDTLPAPAAEPAAKVPVPNPPATVAPLPRAKDPPRSATAAAAGPTPAARAEGERLQIAETVRVEITDMDSVLASLAEASVQVGALRQASAVLDEAQHLTGALAEELRERPALGTAPVIGTPFERLRHGVDQLADSLRKNRRHLIEAVDRAERELWQVRDKVSQLRLLPAHTIFAPLSRAARDAAQVLGRRIEFETRGGEARLEAHVLSAVRNALLHVVRNAVAHGIEPEAERLAAGKPAVGSIELHVERHGPRVAFICRDDGRGIDVDAVRRAAVERGLMSRADAEALSVDDATRLIFHGGLSTARAVDEVSGRGVGLDVVYQVAAEFKGEAAARSQPGRGTTVELRLPISLSALMALAVEAAGLKVWIPLDSVKGTLRVGHKDVAHAAMEDSILHEGRALPFRSLASILGPGESRHAWSAVIVHVDGKWAAVGADRLLEVANIVLRPIPAMAGSFPMLAGAAFDPEGNPQLVLDPHGLTEVVGRGGNGSTETAALAERLPILVIDDSLTTRMLEQAILEAAGYEVDLAVSAEDGLQKALRRRYGLFLCDVEMPGMDGFEFVAHTKADATLRETPTILVTSLSSPADRRRGVDVGAYGYVVKGEFDEERFRQLVRSVAG